MIWPGARAVWLSLAGIIAFAVFLVALLPARLVYAWTAPPDLRVYFIDGTLFSGTAESLQVAGFDFGRTRWRLAPAELLRGRLGFALRADRTDGFLQADVSVGPGAATVWISALEAELPLSIGQALLPIEGVGGVILLDFDEVRLHEGWPDRLEGTFDIDNLVFTQPAVQHMGSYRVQFDTVAGKDDGDLTGVFQDTSGPLDVQGSVQIKDDRRFRVEGRVLARDDAPGQFNETLELLLGPAAADGRRSFSFGGRL